MNAPVEKENSLQLDFKNGRLFPFPFQVVAILFIIAAISFFPTQALISLVLLLLSALILTAHAGVEFSQSHRTYREYNSFLFIKSGKTYPYQGVEKIFINAGRVSQRFYTAHTTTSAVFTNTEYRGYVKLLNGTKIFLISSKNKEKLANRLAPLSDYLQTELIDLT
ncbi:hypothetical protein D770_09320 [Flammeovirgaceae bacterium 311]|nr:hypothetical protein D770_09320 [Flammeovirgaceae bacterium 311]